MTTATLEKRVTKTENNLEKLEDLVFKLGISIDESNKRIEQGFAELRKSQDESNKRMEQGFAKLRKELSEGQAEFRESQKELRESQKELNRQLGGLSRRLGTVVEDLVAPSLGRIFLEVTHLPKDSELIINVRIKKKHAITKESQEFDALVELEKDGDYILVNETKSNLTPEDITDFLQTLEEFRHYIPEYKDQKITIIGAMSSPHLDQSLITALSRRGLLALSIGDTITTLRNPDDFVWKAF